jgi:hypothetical protein
MKMKAFYVRKGIKLRFVPLISVFLENDYGWVLLRTGIDGKTRDIPEYSGRPARTSKQESSTETTFDVGMNADGIYRFVKTRSILKTWTTWIWNSDGELKQKIQKVYQRTLSHKLVTLGRKIDPPSMGRQF